MSHVLYLPLFTTNHHLDPMLSHVIQGRPTLPPELISHIVSCIDSRDTSTLQSLSLTSTHFVAPSQSLLFSHITLSGSDTQDTNPSPSSPSKKLLSLLKSTPRIIGYIKHLTISDAEGGYSSWLPNENTLLEVVNCLNLSSLKSFSIIRHFNATWLLLAPDVKRALLKILSGACNIEELELKHVPLSLLSSCSSKKLKGLRLFHPQVASVESIEAFAGDISNEKRRVQLERLNMWHQWDLDQLTNWLLGAQSHINLTGLRVLDVVAMRPVDYSEITKVLKVCRALQEFKMSICADEEGIVSEFDCPALLFAH